MEEPNASVFYDSEFASASFNEFEDMRKKGLLIDCTVNVKNRCVKAHRLVLAARIPLFRKLLTTSARRVIKIEEDIDPDILESLINFAYTGSVEITTDNVKFVLLVSGYLQINNVYEACWKFLEERLCQENVWQTCILANCYFRLTLESVCYDYIEENFEVFSHAEDFLSTPFSYINEVFSNIELSKEENKFEAIIKWVEFSPTERKELLPELLQTVRVSRLSPKYLTERVSKEHLVEESLGCKDWLYQVKDYNLLSSHNENLECDNLTSQTPLPSPDCGIYAVCNSEFKLFINFMDSKKKKWVTLSQRFLPCIYHVFAIDKRIYIICRRSTEILDVKTMEWHSLEVDHSSLHAAALVSFGDVLYSFGGTGPLATIVRCFNLRQNEWKQENQMRKPRMFAGVTALKNNIYITGGTFNISTGRGFKAGDVYRDAEEYNIQTRACRDIPPMLYCRYDHGCTSLNDLIYVCGGFNSAYLDTAEMYNPLTRKWTCILPMDAVKRLYSVISHDHKLYTLGKRLQIKTPVIDVNIYETESNMWSSEIPVLGDYDWYDAFLVCAETPAKIDVTDNDEGPDLIFEAAESTHQATNVIEQEEN